MLLAVTDLFESFDGHIDIHGKFSKSLNTVNFKTLIRIQTVPQLKLYINTQFLLTLARRRYTTGK